jgi:hypothetical protein
MLAQHLCNTVEDVVTNRYERTIRLLGDSASDAFSSCPATEDELLEAERELRVSLPESYKALQLELGEMCGAILEIYSVKAPQTGMLNIIGITKCERTECFPNLPSHLVPFSSNGGGDSYCFDTSKLVDGECPIVFWDHTSGAEQELEVVAADFLEWIELEIGWRRESTTN